MILFQERDLFMLRVEVVYATEKEQQIIDVKLPYGSTISKAIKASGVLNNYPELDLKTMQVGVFSQRKKLDDELVNGDRVEIYRPLVIDPKTKRREKADRQKERKQFL